MHLIASGLDVRIHLNRAEIRKSTGLQRVLKALDELQSEIGWKQWDSKSSVKHNGKV